MKQLYLSIVIICLFFIEVKAQDPQFTQFYAAPLYLNPAYAGSIPASRVNFNGRVQWAGLPNAFNTYATSFDHNFEKIRSGLGVIAIMDKAGAGSLSRTSISGIYSYKININSKWIVKPAVQFTYASSSLDFYKLTFGDQLDLNGASGIATGESFNRANRVNYFDFSAGTILYNEKYWFGLSSSHLNRPNQSLTGGVGVIPIKTNLHGGMKIDLTNSVYKTHGKAREQSLTPTFIYRFQGKYDQVDLGAYYYFEPLVIGLWYRGIPVLKHYKPGYGNSDAAAVLIGLRQENFSIGYSYDLTVSKLGPSKTAGAHEISLSYILGKDDGKYNKKHKVKKKDMVIPCPKF